MPNTEGPNAQEARDNDKQHKQPAPAPDAASQYMPLTPDERESAFKIAVGECIGFYKLIIYISITFLSGTLAFIEKIAPHPTPWTHHILGGGWLFLIAALVLVAWVRRLNIEAGRLYLLEDHGKGSEVQERARLWTTASWCSMSAGVFCIMLFGYLNFVFGGVVSTDSAENKKDEQSLRAPGPEHDAGQSNRRLDSIHADSDRHELAANISDYSGSAASTSRTSTASPAVDPIRADTTSSNQASSVKGSR